MSRKSKRNGIRFIGQQEKLMPYQKVMLDELIKQMRNGDNVEILARGGGKTSMLNEITDRILDAGGDVLILRPDGCERRGASTATNITHEFDSIIDVTNTLSTDQITQLERSCAIYMIGDDFDKNTKPETIVCNEEIFNHPAKPPH